MSKEQTPITAEEWSINGDGAESTYWLSVFFAGLGKSDKLADVFKIMEQYAQAKVLEALEREEKFFCDNSKINALRSTLSNAEWRRLIKIHFRRSTKQK